MREETRSPPSWGSAPEWAQWLAMDADGEWSWHDRKPKRDFESWVNFFGKQKKKAGPRWRKHCLDWTKCIEERPEVKKMRADFIVEDLGELGLHTHIYIDGKELEGVYKADFDGRELVITYMFAELLPERYFYPTEVTINRFLSRHVGEDGKVILNPA